MSDYMFKGLSNAIQNLGSTLEQATVAFSDFSNATINITGNDVWETTCVGYREESPWEKVEGNCPSCGAPITGEKCEYCGRVHYRRK